MIRHPEPPTSTPIPAAVLAPAPAPQRTAPAPGPAPGSSGPDWPHLSGDDLALVALLGLPFLSWDRLRALLQGRTPSQAWAAVCHGQAGPGLRRAAAAGPPLAELAATYATVPFARHGSPRYPPALAADHEAPAAVFWRGDLSVLDRPRVALVGTRRCTHYGRDVARQLGHELAQAGVCVVSGLAAGIDGAAHEGALVGVAEAEADGGAPGRPVAVVGSGLDIVYPRRHARLWERVAEAGVVLTEAPLGARPEPWRFPARNRIIAALAHVLVVVESRATGGSMHTVRAAEERGVPVLAVPGPVRSRASEGTNLLLSQGCHPACDTQDVLAALALRTAGLPGPVGYLPHPERPEPEGLAAAVLAAVDWTPTAVEQVLARTDLPVPAVSAALNRLEQDGWVAREAGWWQRC
ncbi:MAG TPA: DNA-processing protein DprA [Acidimicrobiales bacterium]|nr:DNA-processing protein DprA [Acidimicrobiales bacterium]